MILKILGRNVSFCILEQHLQDLWKLSQGYEMIDLEHGYVIARFFTKKDYIRVLT